MGSARRSGVLVSDGISDEDAEDTSGVLGGTIVLVVDGDIVPSGESELMVSEGDEPSVDGNIVPSGEAEVMVSEGDEPSG